MVKSTNDNIRAYSLFKKLGGECSLLEIKLRVITERFVAIRKYAYSPKLAELEKHLIPLLKREQYISESEAKDLINSRKLRNKIMHGEFKSAKDILGEYNLPKSELGVVDIVRSKSGKIQRKKVTYTVKRLIPNDPPFTVTGFFPIMERTQKLSVKNSSYQSWLLEAEFSSLFPSASQFINKSLAVADRILEKSDPIPVIFF